MGKNWYMNDSKSEKQGLLYTRIFVGIIAILFYVFGLFVKTDEAEWLYSALHPASFLNIVGVVLFTISLLWFGVVFKTKIQNLVVPQGSVWPNWVLFGISVLAVLFMYA